MLELFTEWIFIWFLLFYFKFTSYNPLFILIFAFIITSFVHIYIIFNSNTKLYHAIKFGVFNIILKVIPILLISHTTIYFKDIYFGFIIFIIYLIYMTILKFNVIYIYGTMIDEYANGKDEYRSDLSKLYDDIFSILPLSYTSVLK